jgi:hypothetical protein
MKPLTIFRAAFFVLLIATVAAVADRAPPAYPQGTITGWSTQRYSDNWSLNGAPSATRKHEFYELKGAGTLSQINDCGDFQTGQTVAYRVQDGKVYIRREGDNERPYSIEGAKADAPSAAVPSTAH